MASRLPPADATLRSGPVAWLGDRLVPQEEACLPVWDLGLTQGIAVAEQLRTVRHELWGLEGHLDRLERGLAAAGIVPPCKRKTLVERIQLVARLNAELLRTEDDLSVFVSVSSGSSLAHSPRSWDNRWVNAPSLDATQAGSGHAAIASPRTVIWATPIAFWRWNVALDEGLHLVTVQVPELPEAAAPRELKSRSRMHYWLAERAANEIAPDALPLLKGTDGFIADTSIGSMALVNLAPRLVLVPLKHQALLGVTLRLMVPLFERMGFAVEAHELTESDLAAADEILWLSTPVFGLPVSRFNNQPAGAGWQGAFWSRFTSLLASDLGLDPWRQARQFAHPEAG